MLKDPDTESAEAKKHPVRDRATEAVGNVGALYPELVITAARNPDKAIQDESRKALKKIGAPLMEEMAGKLGEPKLRPRWRDPGRHRAADRAADHPVPDDGEPRPGKERQARGRHQGPGGA